VVASVVGVRLELANGGEARLSHQIPTTQDPPTTRIVLADDEELIRYGLMGILAREEDMEVVGEASTGSEALRLCRSLRPEIVLMDVEMPEMDGLSATRQLKEDLPTISVLILTAHDNPDYMLEAVQAGAAGFLLKESALQHVASAVRRLTNGEPLLDQELAVRLLKRLSPQRGGVGNREAEVDEKLRTKMLEALTDRELEILDLLSNGMSNQQIAQQLFLSLSTVKTHVHRIILKLEVSDRTQAAVRAIRLGLVSA
jgi:DNA-binding NarL/FixJ family response regulator